MMMIMMIIKLFLLRYFTHDKKIHNLIMENMKAFFGESTIIFLCKEKLTGETRRRVGERG